MSNNSTGNQLISALMMAIVSLLKVCGLVIGTAFKFIGHGLIWLSDFLINTSSK